MTEGKHRLQGFEERELDWRGTRLRYAVGGSDDRGVPPLVLVHGLGGTIENWQSLAPRLAARHRVLVPDLPGHGHSGLLPEARDVDALADALLGIVRPRSRAAPSGSGTRSAVSSGFAPRCCSPTRCVGSCSRRPQASAPARVAPRSRSRVLGITKPGRLIAPHRHAWANSRLGRRVAFGWWGVADPDALEPEQAEAFLVGPAHHTDTRQAGRALLASDPRTELDRVTCPCLCLWGASDNWVRLDDGMEYARRLRAPLRTIAGCGHLLIGERPDACLAAIQEFVASLAR